MKKIYICGLAASGKGLMKQLLDGHSKLSMMPFQGFILKSLMSYNFESNASNPRLSSPYRTEYFKHMPFFNILKNGTRYKVNFDEFARNIYYNYDLYIVSHSERLWGEAGKGKEALVEFVFDYPQFEQDWFEKLFKNHANVTIEGFLDIMYECFLDNWKNKYIDQDNIEGMVTTIQNGIEHIHWLLDNTGDSKLLLMERNGVGFSYAIANKRAVKYNKDILSQIYDFEVINVLKKYRDVIYSKELQANPRVLIVDFDNLVLDTRNTMTEIAEFLEIEFEDILTEATLNRVSLETDSVRFTGKINENPYESLSQDAIDFLEYLHFGPDKVKQKWKAPYFHARALMHKVCYKVSYFEQRAQRLFEILRRR